MAQPKQLISILVPLGGSDPFRLEVWNWLREYYESHLYGIEIVIGRDRRNDRHWRNEPFSKAAAVNDAFRHSHGDIIVILDADCYIDAQVILHWAERLRKQRDAGVRSWAVPYRFLLRLTKLATEELIKSNPIHPFQFPQPLPPKDLEGTDGSGWGHVYGALIQIMPREAFIFVGGMDERHRGWGGEDRALLLKLDALWGPYQNSPNNVYHLWHPKIVAAEGIDEQGRRAEIRAWTGQKTIRSNDWLSAQYNWAEGNAEKMIRVIGGNKMAAPVKGGPVKKTGNVTKKAPAKVVAPVVVEPVAVVVTPPPAPIPASWTVNLKKIAAEVASVGASIGAVIATVVNIAPVVHIPAPEVTILVAVGSILSTIVIELQGFVGTKMAAKRAAKR